MKEFLFRSYLAMPSHVVFLLLDRNSSVSMGASLTAPEYSLKVADVGKVRALNAIAKNTL